MSSVSGEVETKVYPVTDGDTQGNKSTVDENDPTTSVGRTHLSSIHRDGGRSQPSTNASEDPAHQKLSKSVRACLKGTANSDNNGGNKNTL